MAVSKSGVYALCGAFVLLAVLGKCAIDRRVAEKGRIESELVAADVQAAAVLAKAEAAAQKPREPTLADKLTVESNLANAIALIRPGMSDTVNEISPGANLLALWGARRMTWADLQALPETKRALVMKDPEEERGKRLCVTGTITEIQVDRSSGAPVYNGGIFTPGMDVVRFIAVGSTGALVENSGARLCGVVTGKYSYSNAGGGTTHAAFVVGMFDLPANKAKP